MKSVLKIVIPSVLIFLLAYLLQGGKNIIDGLFIYFPLINIIMGVICGEFLKELLPCSILSSIAFIVPVNIWYHMGTCVDLMLIYVALMYISFFIKKLIKRKMKK